MCLSYAWCRRLALDIFVINCSILWVVKYMWQKIRKHIRRISTENAFREAAENGLYKCLQKSPRKSLTEIYILIIVINLIIFINEMILKWVLQNLKPMLYLVYKFNRSRVGLCALSAGWTGSCQSDEKETCGTWFASRCYSWIIEYFIFGIIFYCSKGLSAKEVIFLCVKLRI